MRVERVSDNARNQKFKVKNERQESRQVDHARKQEIDRLNAEATRGDKEAQRQVRQLEQQQEKRRVLRIKGPAQSSTATAERTSRQSGEAAVSGDFKTGT